MLIPLSVPQYASAASNPAVINYQETNCLHYTGPYAPVNPMMIDGTAIYSFNRVPNTYGN